MMKIIGFLCSSLLVTALSAATLTVDLNGGADYTDIQSAIDAAADGDTVLVKPGEYVITEPINFNRLHDPENPASPPVKNIVVKSESGAEVTTIKGPGVEFSNSETNATLLEGFTITGGSGVRYFGSSPILINCTISGNSASYGGGVYCSDGSSPTITNSTITGNSAGDQGGGVYCYDSSPTLTNCTISGNSASYGGGGVYCYDSSPTLTNCTITGNSAQRANGGGVSCYYSSSPTLTNCTISGNSAFIFCCCDGGCGGGNGGGVCCWESSPILMNCTISGNLAQGGNGGGVSCIWGSSPTLTNCTITGNSAVNFLRGSGGNGGGVYCGENSSPTLTSCITWDNVGGSFVISGVVQPNVFFSCLETETVWPGEGNINADPLFCGWGEKDEVWVDPSKPGPGDGSQGNPFPDPRVATTYSLAFSAGSPCLGTGKDGADMGADPGKCGGPNGAARIVHLAPGTYAAEDLDLAHKVSLLGAGQDSTVIKGTVFGLRTGSSLADLTVTKGTWGGIVVCAGDSPDITSCKISGNSASDGGGVHCWENSSPTLTNCIISGNLALLTWVLGEPLGGVGGGVFCEPGSSPTLTNCTLSGNSAADGGGLCCSGGSPTLTNCTISGNSATWRGGNGSGVRCSGSSPTLTNCTISGNYSADYLGGGVYCYDSSPILTNCTISGNSFDGVYCGQNSSPTLTNCTFSGNSFAGVSCEWGASPTLTNCTISGNGGWGVNCDEYSSPTLTNCIVWGDTSESVCGNLSHCLTDQDPLFVRPGEWMECGSPDDPECIAYQWNPETGEPTAWHRWVFDYRLQPGSPAIDAGTSEGAPTTDIEGHGRPCGAAVDIGAYEFGDCAGPGCGDPNGDEDLDGIKNGSEDLNGDGVCVSHDTDGDGIPNILDSDDDGDGVPTADELVYQDTDGDEIPNYLDDDDDGDGVPSRLEDLNGNGDPSDDDPNSDGIPAYLDPNEKPPLVLFRRGDANADSRTDISDGVAILNYLFLGGTAVSCEQAGDANDDGLLDISDGIYVLNFLFTGGKPIDPPVGVCGVDPTGHALSCNSFPACM